MEREIFIPRVLIDFNVIDQPFLIEIVSEVNIEETFTHAIHHRAAHLFKVSIRVTRPAVLLECSFMSLHCILKHKKVTHFQMALYFRPRVSNMKSLGFKKVQSGTKDVLPKSTNLKRKKKL